MLCGPTSLVAGRLRGRKQRSKKDGGVTKSAQQAAPLLLCHQGARLLQLGTFRVRAAVAILEKLRVISGRLPGVSRELRGPRGAIEPAKPAGRYAQISFVLRQGFGGTVFLEKHVGQHLACGDSELPGTVL